MAVTACKLLRQTDLVYTTLGSSCQATYAVTYTGAMSEGDIIAGALTASPNPIPDIGDPGTLGIQCVSQRCRKISSTSARVTVFHSNKPYWSGSSGNTNYAPTGRYDRQYTTVAIPIWKQGPDDVWRLQWFDRPRVVWRETYSVFVDTGAFEPTEVRNEIYEAAGKYRAFTASKRLLLDDWIIQTVRANQLYIQLSYSAPQRFKAMTAAQLGSDVDIPALRALDTRYLPGDGSTLSSPVVGTERYEDVYEQHTAPFTFPIFT